MQQNKGYLFLEMRVLEMSFWTVSYVGRSIRKKQKVELGLLDYIMQGKYKKNVCQIKLPRDYETRLNHEEGV